MTTFLSILIALDSAMLIFVILIQKPKGGGIDSTFGGGFGANQMLGAARSVDFIEKLTWILAAILFVLSIITAIYVGSIGADAGVSDIPLKSAG